jgi:hypothetical protein
MRPLLLGLALLGSTFAGVPARAADSPGAPAEEWKISGWEVTTCCCNDICPCRYNEKPTHMECEGIISIHVDKGYFGKTQLDNVNFILVSRGFDENGPGWNKLYIDQKATPEQQKAIGGLLTSIASSYKPDVAKKIFGTESRGMKTVAMTFTKSNGGLVREVDAPGVVSVKARLGKVPTSKKPMYLQGVLTEFSPIFYPAAGIDARADTAEVPFDHPVHHRAEVEDFTLTRQDVMSRRIGFQLYDGRGGCLLPAK